MARQPRPRPNLHAHYHAVSRRADRLSKLISAKKGVVEVRDQAHIGDHTAQAILVKDGKDIDMPEEFTGCGQCADSDPTAKRPGTWCLMGASCSLCQEDAQEDAQEDPQEDAASVLMMQAFKRERIVCDSPGPLKISRSAGGKRISRSAGGKKISRSAGGKKTL
jgi:hypothetical protein